MNRNLQVPMEVMAPVSQEPFSGFLSLLPPPPWLGPPLPRFLQIYWPWVQAQDGSPQKVDDYLTGHFEFHRGREIAEPSEEEVEVIRDETGAIKKVIKRRSPAGGG